MFVDWYYVNNSKICETYKVYSVREVNKNIQFLIYDNNDWVWINAEECVPNKINY